MYFEIIKDPIDLRTIAQHLQNMDYASLDDLVRDLNLMVANARQFNEPGSQIYRVGNLLRFYRRHFLISSLQDASTLRKIISSKHHDILELQKATGGTPAPIVRSARIRSKKLGNINKVFFTLYILKD